MKSKKTWTRMACAMTLALTAPFLCVAAAAADDGMQEHQEIEITEITPEELEAMLKTEDIDETFFAFPNMSINAYIQQEGTSIVSCVVPTNLSIAVTLDADNGTFKKGVAATSSIENKATSSLPVRIDVSDVVDTPAIGSSKGILYYSLLHLDAYHPREYPSPNPFGNKVPVIEGMEPATLYSRIVPGEKFRFDTLVEADPEHLEEPIVAGKYTTQIMMKVTTFIGEDS